VQAIPTASAATPRFSPPGSRKEGSACVSERVALADAPAAMTRLLERKVGGQGGGGSGRLIRGANRRRSRVFDNGRGSWFPRRPEEIVAETSLRAPPATLRLSPGWLLFAALAARHSRRPLLLHRRAPALPELGELPAFSADRSARARVRGRDDLRGKVWVLISSSRAAPDACPAA